MNIDIIFNEEVRESVEYLIKKLFNIIDDKKLIEIIYLLPSFNSNKKYFIKPEMFKKNQRSNSKKYIFIRIILYNLIYNFFTIKKQIIKYKLFLYKYSMVSDNILKTKGVLIDKSENSIPFSSQLLQENFINKINKYENRIKKKMYSLSSSIYIIYERMLEGKKFLEPFITKNAEEKINFNTDNLDIVKKILLFNISNSKRHLADFFKDEFKFIFNDNDIFLQYYYTDYNNITESMTTNTFNLDDALSELIRYYDLLIKKIRNFNEFKILFSNNIGLKINDAEKIIKYSTNKNFNIYLREKKGKPSFKIQDNKIYFVVDILLENQKIFIRRYNKVIREYMFIDITDIIENNSIPFDKYYFY